MLYKTKIAPFGATRYEELVKQARTFYRTIEKQTMRRPYIRSAYFDKDKVFLDYFWDHLNQKPRRERLKRLRYLRCALDLIQRNRYQPTIKVNPNNSQELLFRFTGETLHGEVFYVQVKENLKTKHKHFMSVFPEK